MCYVGVLLFHHFFVNLDAQAAHQPGQRHWAMCTRCGRVLLIWRNERESVIWLMKCQEVGSLLWLYCIFARRGRWPCQRVSCPWEIRMKCQSLQIQNATTTFTSTTVWLIWICRLFGASQLKRITRCRAHLVLWSAIMFNNETALIIDDWVVVSYVCVLQKLLGKLSSPLSPRSIVPVRRLLFRLIEPSQTQCQYRSWTLFLTLSYKKRRTKWQRSQNSAPARFCCRLSSLTSLHVNNLPLAKSARLRLVLFFTWTIDQWARGEFLWLVGNDLSHGSCLKNRFVFFGNFNINLHFKTKKRKIWNNKLAFSGRA